MRLLHTSDWHLGRIFHGKSLVEDQHAALQHLLEVLRMTDIDALLIAGDIYDRAIPPVEAMALLDWFLSEVLLSLEIPVVLIAGNHDSPERLGFGSRLLAGRRLHVASHLGSRNQALVLEDDHGSVFIYGIPYADPPLVRESLSSNEIIDHQTAMHAVVQDVLSAHPAGARSILVAHAFVAGGLASDSERPLSVAGAGTISAQVFAPFSYTALGHLHRPQIVGDQRVQYSGSLLRYSFSELAHEKSVSVVELSAPGEPPQVERISIKPPRELRQIRGTLAELVAAAPADARPGDYLLVSLEDEGPVLDPLGKLRPFYPNVLHVERTRLSVSIEAQTATKVRKRESERDLFASFFQEVTGEVLNEAQSHALISWLDEWKRGEEREISPESPI